MSTNSVKPRQTFEEIWNDLAVVLPPGSIVGKYCGCPFTILAVTDSSVTINSPDAGGPQEIPKHTFEIVYADWHTYRYENLSRNNPQEILHVISITDHIMQTWRSREERAELIAKAREAGIPDGVFWVVRYNRQGRKSGLSPAGEPVPLNEVFRDQPPALLSELEVAASRLYEASSTLSEFVYLRENHDVMNMLIAQHPGFGKDVYSSVVVLACFLAVK